jgi:hypothetical protein
MNLFRVAAAVMALVLVFQTGCDLWCHHAEQMAAVPQDGAAPPCHGAGESPSDTEDQSSGNHGTTRDCLHPQAADDSSKLQAKIVKESQPVGVIEFSGVPLRLETREWQMAPLATNVMSPSGRPLTVLRI